MAGCFPGRDGGYESWRTSHQLDARVYFSYYCPAGHTTLERRCYSDRSKRKCQERSLQRFTGNKRHGHSGISGNLVRKQPITNILQAERCGVRRFSYTNANSDSYSDPDFDANTNCDTNANANCDTNANSDADANSDTNTESNTNLRIRAKVPDSVQQDKDPGLFPRRHRHSVSLD